MFNFIMKNISILLIKQIQSNETLINTHTSYDLGNFCFVLLLAYVISLSLVAHLSNTDKTFEIHVAFLLICFYIWSAPKKRKDRFCFSCIKSEIPVVNLMCGQFKINPIQLVHVFFVS